MLILSQDRESIINFDRFRTIQAKDTGCILADYSDTDEYTLLGKYDTVDRAKEVLLEII